VQEALTNVRRHSAARGASVLVERRDGHVVAIVEDDGKGFDVAAVKRRGVASEDDGDTMLGLLGVRERAALLGGSVEMESTPGKGTTLFVRIPIPGAKPARSERPDRSHK
jgi:signal transduction histidine kinase